MGIPTEILGVGPRRVKQAADTMRLKHPARHLNGAGGSATRRVDGPRLLCAFAAARSAGAGVTSHHHPCCSRLSITPNDVTTAAMYTRTIFASPS